LKEHIEVSHPSLTETAVLLANFGVGSAKTTNQTTFRANQGIGILKRISLLNASECI
jgi:hypothetical protein